MCLAARAEIALGNFDKAGKFLEEVVRRHPDFAVAHDVSGDLLFAQGYAGTAIKAYEQALRLDPARSATLTKIERARQLLDQAHEKSEPAKEASITGRQMAFGEEMHNAEQFMKANDPNPAEDIYRKILKYDPNHVEAARMLAKIAADNHQHDDAEVFLRHAIEIAPDYARLWVDLANVLKELNKTEEMLTCADKVLALAPDVSESHVLHGIALGANSAHEEATVAYKKALQISPQRPSVLCSLAHHLKTVGEQDESIETYRRCMEVKPDHSEAYWSLANFKTFQFSESEIEIMKALLEREDLPEESRVQVNNALGLDRESRGMYDEAFSHYARCNSLRRKAEDYDPVETETRIDGNIEIFSQEFLDNNTGHGNDDGSPIFVVGLPRSGSTLIEQILASHSMVDGTHELHDLMNVSKRIRQRVKVKKNARYPETLLDLSPGDWQEIGADYIESTKKYRSGAPYFIDKNPNNFTYIGLIRLALPNAKIINAKRHPLDSCFGSFKQLFASGQQFSYDLVEVGEYYLQYDRLVRHFHELLPGFILDVQYEEMVADLDSQVGRLLDFCDLPFEEACLRFHETERAVKTASSEQVRRPIYSTSVNLWRNYEQHLEELIDVLQPLLQEMPETDRPSGIRQIQA
jgi:tetratricopeptide (TPR) repeat protein